MPEHECSQCGGEMEIARHLFYVSKVGRQYTDRILKEADGDEAVLIEDRAEFTDHIRNWSQNSAIHQRITETAKNRHGPHTYPILSVDVEWWDSITAD